MLQFHAAGKCLHEPHGLKAGALQPSVGVGGLLLRLLKTGMKGSSDAECLLLQTGRIPWVLRKWLAVLVMPHMLNCTSIAALCGCFALSRLSTVAVEWAVEWLTTHQQYLLLGVNQTPCLIIGPKGCQPLACTVFVTVLAPRLCFRFFKCDFLSEGNSCAALQHQYQSKCVLLDCLLYSDARLLSIA